WYMCCWYFFLSCTQFAHLCLFFYCPGDHRDLHSFPTRRSSDLGGDGAQCAGCALAAAGRLGECSSGPRLPSATRRGASAAAAGGDRKSTRLNSSHVKISYAVFCLKKKKNKHEHLNKTNTHKY